MCGSSRASRPCRGWPRITGVDRWGHGLNGSQSDDGIWNVGFRYGLILTRRMVPVFCAAAWEYAVDRRPRSSWSPRETNTAYGVGINPFAFKWRWTRTACGFRISNLARTLFTIQGAPKEHLASISRPAPPWACTSSVASTNISTEVRYMHISTRGFHRRIPASNHSVSFGFGRQPKRLAGIGPRPIQNQG